MHFYSPEHVCSGHTPPCLNIIYYRFKECKWFGQKNRRLFYLKFSFSAVSRHFRHRPTTDFHVPRQSTTKRVPSRFPAFFRVLSRASAHSTDFLLFLIRTIFSSAVIFRFVYRFLDLFLQMVHFWFTYILHFKMIFYQKKSAVKNSADFIFPCSVFTSRRPALPPLPRR